MIARKRRANIDETIENIQPSPSPLNGIKRKIGHRITNKTIYQCHYCPQQFLLKYNLVDHEFIHVLNQDKPKRGTSNFVPMKVPASIKAFSCPHCPNKFTTRQNVTKHIRNQHSNANPFECEQCSMTFGTKNHLDQHRYVHRVKGVWPCNLCKMQFHGESQLINHKRIHTWIVSLESHFPFNVDDSKVNFQSVRTEPNGQNATNRVGKWNHVMHRTATAAVATATVSYKDVAKRNIMQTTDIISISSDSQAPPVKRNNAKNRKTRPKCDECNQSFCDTAKLKRHQLIHSGVRKKDKSD